MLSVKLALNRLVTVSPPLLVGSSVIATNVALPEAMGASLTAATLTVTVAVSVAPPLVTV